MDAQTTHALIRFGLGRRGEEAVPTDPVAWLTQQVEAPDPAPFDARLPTTADGLTVAREQFKLALPSGASLIKPLFEQDVLAQTGQLLTTAAPFRERLVWFWANHFTVSTRQGGTSAVIGPYIREAIRPNVTGPFFGMLLAVMRHPAMLMYLDNNNSFGPGSAAGKAQKRGLNENLARECLELHTVSPAAGYTQEDVTEFARVLTGWSIDYQRLFPGWLFRPGAHEPGMKTVMGRHFAEGEAGGIAALQFLASHPATHRHLAAKLVRHFVSDTPAPEAVRTIEGVLRDTDGDLGAAHRAGPPARRLDTADEAARAAGFRRRRPARLGLTHRQAAPAGGGADQPWPAAVDGAATQWLARPGGGVGRARGDDAPDRLGLWPCRPRRGARRPRPGGGCRRRPGAVAEPPHPGRHAGCRQPPRRPDPAVHLPRVPEALT